MKRGENEGEFQSLMRIGEKRSANSRLEGGGRSEVSNFPFLDMIYICVTIVNVMFVRDI